MKHVLLIGHHEIRMFLRDKAGWVWLAVVPLLFSFFMGFAARGPGKPTNPRPGVLIENLDQGFMGQLVVNELKRQDLRVLEQGTEASRRLIIPTNFTATITTKQQAKVEFLRIKGSTEESAAMIELRLLRALIALNAGLIERALSSGDAALQDEHALQTVLERPKPVRVESRFAGRRPVPVRFNQSLPGNLVMFLMLNLLIFGGAGLAEERKAGVLRRLAVHPLRRQHLVLGKIYGRFLLGLFQASVMLAFGQLALGVPVLRDPLGTLLLVMTYCWACASLGVLVGATTSNPDKIIGLCILSSLLMAAIGGCWWPLEIAPDWLKTLAHTVPTGWAMDGFHRLISFGGSWRDIGLVLAVLAGFGVAGSVVAGKCLRL